MTVRSEGKGHELELCIDARFLADLFADSRSADPTRMAASIARSLSDSLALESTTRSRERSMETPGSDKERKDSRRRSMESGSVDAVTLGRFEEVTRTGSSMVFGWWVRDWV